MCLNHVEEIFYGGALGGGKSEWLLMEALQYVDIPDYHALILRRSLADANKASSIMFRANQWLSGTDARQRGNTWHFPSGAVLEFGGIDKKNDHFKFDGSEYAFIAVDEFTKLNYSQATYVMGTRLRKPGCSDHKNKRIPGCRYCKAYLHTDLFPLRIRTASNPGGESHLQVKQRYDIGLIEGRSGPYGKLYQGRNPDRPHIPAFIRDNPFLDENEYIDRLRHNLEGDVTTLYRMMAGDWGITADSRFRQAWVKRWRWEGNQAQRIHLDGDRWFDRSACYEFIMVDPASSSEDTPGRTELGKKSASFTVVSRWMVTPRNDLCLIHVDRFQREMPEIIPAIKKQMQTSQGRVRFVGMEHTTQSKHLYQDARNKGLPMQAFKTDGKDKISRSYDASSRMKDGKIFLPDPGPKWLQDYEDEVFTWTGAPEEPDDQVDVTSYAAMHVTQQSINAGVPVMA